VLLAIQMSRNICAKFLGCRGSGATPYIYIFASKALQAMRLTCNQDNSVRFRMEAQKHNWIYVQLAP
jgi:hypothetical protein